MLDEQRGVPLVFGGDMSQDRTSQVVDLCGAIYLCLHLAWTGEDDPVGVFALKLSNHGDLAGTWEAYSVDIPPSVQPSGASGSLMLDNITTSAAYAIVEYAATSGGAGDIIHDGSAAKNPGGLLVMRR